MIFRQDGTFHEWFIPKLAAVLGCERYLELGTYTGTTFNPIAQIVLDRGGHAVGVDTVPLSVTYEGAEFFQMTTDDFFANVQPRLAYTYDLVFIDADHNEKQLWKDLNAVEPLVEEHGLVLLHDTFPIRPEDAKPGYSDTAYLVASNLDCMRNDADWEHVTLPFGPGLTILRKRYRHLPWSNY